MNRPIVLVVDNDPDVPRGIKEFIADCFPVLVFMNARTVQEATDFYRTWKDNIFLIIVEDHLHGVSDWLCNWFRALGYGGLLVALYDHESTLKKMREAGCDEELTKPFPIQKLHYLAQKALDDSDRLTGAEP